MRFLILTLLFFIVGCSSMPRAIEPDKDVQAGPPEKVVYIFGHGKHTGIVLNAEDLNRLIPALSDRFPQMKYYEVGWGEGAYYMADEPTSYLALEALFWSSGSVMQVIAFSKSPEQYFPNAEMRIIRLSQGSYLDMLKFMQSSFKFDDKGNPVPLKRGHHENSQFYESIGNYYFMNTCNNWTARALYSAGLNVSTSCKITQSSVMDSLEK